MGLFSPKLSSKQLALLCKSLTVMSEGSITLERSLQLLSGEHATRPIRHVLIPIVDALQRGESPGKAFRSQAKRFPEFFLEMVDVGDRTGKLETVFRDLTVAYEEQAELVRFYVNGASYPLALYFAVGYGIPLLTAFLTSVASNKPDFGAFALRFIAGSTLHLGSQLLILVVLGHLGILRRIAVAVGHRLWVVKGIVSDIALARFFRALAICLDAGLGIVASIERAASVTTHPRIRAALMTAVPLVQRGETLEVALKSTGLMPEMALTMVHTGEFAGKLDELLNKTAQYLYEAARHRTRVLSIALVTLALIILMLLYIIGGVIVRAIQVILSMNAWN